MEYSTNEYGTIVSLHKCADCGSEFTICPPKEWSRGCMSPECDSYDPECDVDILFGDFSGFNRYCERTGKDPKKIGPRGRLRRDIAE